MSKTKQIVAETPKELADVLDLPDATAQEWQDYRHMQCNNLLNDFAYRCFRDVADGDYISARMAGAAPFFSPAPRQTEGPVPTTPLAGDPRVHKVPRRIWVLSLDKAVWEIRRYCIANH